MQRLATTTQPLPTTTVLACSTMRSACVAAIALQTLTETACATTPKSRVAPTLRLATTTPLQRTTMAHVLKTTPLAFVVVHAKLTLMATAFVMMWTHVWVTWTLVAFATVTTLLARVARTPLLVTTLEPPLRMALVCMRTLWAFAVERALRTQMPMAFVTMWTIALVPSTTAACATVTTALARTALVWLMERPFSTTAAFVAATTALVQIARVW